MDFSAEVSNGMTYGSYVKADAVETVKLYALLRAEQEYNVSLTEEDEARLQQQRQQYVTYYGGEEGYHGTLSCWALRLRRRRPYLLYARLSLYTADGSAMHPAGADRRLRSGKGLCDGEAAVLARLRW